VEGCSNVTDIRHPNIVVLIADDHRYESIAANGNDVVRTPNLDALAARGSTFDGAHCQGGMHGAVCVPARASLMTGRSIFASTMDPTGRDSTRTLAIPPDLATFPHALREAGYDTYAVGKWHNDAASFARSFSDCGPVMFGGMSDHRRVPLRRFDPTGRYPDDEVTVGDGFSTDIFTDAAVDYLNRDHDAAPFCLYVVFTAPHDPRTPPDGYRFDPRSVELSPNSTPLHPFDNGWMTGRDERLAGWPRREGEIRQHLADYYGMIAHLDAAVGRIVTALERSGKTGETVVIYTADHGLALGQHGLMGKQNLYEHSLRIPLILAGPGVPAGVRSPALVWHGDTTATIRSFAGLPADPTLEGVDLVPVVRGEASSPRELFGAAFRYGQRMIRDDRYKLIRYSLTPPSLRGTELTHGSVTTQLFDLEDDPWETANLSPVPEMQPVRRRLEAELHHWQQQVGDLLPALEAC
jgi:arylsulfatase A-like enzyme